MGSANSATSDVNGPLRPKADFGHKVSRGVADYAEVGANRTYKLSVRVSAKIVCRWHGEGLNYLSPLVGDPSCYGQIETIYNYS